MVVQQNPYLMKDDRLQQIANSNAQTQRFIAEKERKLERMLKPYAAKLQKPKIVQAMDATVSGSGVTDRYVAPA